MKVDAISWKIIEALQADGRQSLKALAETVGLSLPAVSERVKRLEEAGVIEGYSARINTELLGYGVEAVIGITTSRADKPRLMALLNSRNEVIECLHVTGADSYLIRVVTTNLRHLESFVGYINHLGETRTSIVMSHPIRRRAIQPWVEPFPE